MLCFFGASRTINNQGVNVGMLLPPQTRTSAVGGKHTKNNIVVQLAHRGVSVVAGINAGGTIACGGLYSINHYHRDDPDHCRSIVIIRNTQQLKTKAATESMHCHDITSSPSGTTNPAIAATLPEPCTSAQQYITK
jgi:hypothetical protein